MSGTGTGWEAPGAVGAPSTPVAGGGTGSGWEAPGAAPAATAPAAKSGGGGIGGFFGGAGHWIASKAGIAGHDISQIPAGLLQVAEAPVLDTYAGLQHIATGKGNVNDVGRHSVAIGKGFLDSGKLAAQHPLRDPFNTVTWALPLGHGLARAGLGLGDAAAAARAGEGGVLKAALSKPKLITEPRTLSTPGGGTQTLAASRNALRRAYQQAHDQIVQRAINEKPDSALARYGYSRINGSLSEISRARVRVRQAVTSQLRSASQPVSGEIAKAAKTIGLGLKNTPKTIAQAALELVSHNTTPEEAMLRAEAAIEHGVNPELNAANIDLYKEIESLDLVHNLGPEVAINPSFVRTAKAEAILHEGGTAVDTEIAARGLRPADQLESRRNLPAAVTQRLKPFTENKITPGLRRASDHFESIDREYRRQLQKEQDWMRRNTEDVADLLTPGRTGGASVGLDNPYRERIVALGHLHEEALQKVQRLERMGGKGAHTVVPEDLQARSDLLKFATDKFGRQAALDRVGLLDARAHQYGLENDIPAAEFYKRHLRELRTSPTLEHHDALLQIDPFHGFDEAKTTKNLRAKLNPRTQKSGLPSKKAVLTKEGIHFSGDIKPEAWVKRVLHTIPDPAERDYAARWYEHFEPVFRKHFPPDVVEKLMRAFAVSQANAGVSEGIGSSLVGHARLEAGEPVTRQSLASLAADNIEKAIRGEKIDSGVAAKLSDFIDALRGSETRTWMGHDVRGGMPAPSDVWSGRDIGHIDQKIGSKKRDARLLRMHGVDVNKLEKTSSGSYSGRKYEYIAEKYHAITDHLNATAFDGRSDWTPAQVQALGWSTIQKFYGEKPEDLAAAVLKGRGVAERIMSRNEREKLTAQAASFHEVPVDEGFAAIQRAHVENKRNWNLSGYSIDELRAAGARVFLAADGKAGFVLAPEGSGVSSGFFNNSGIKGLGSAAVHRAVQEGKQTLNAFDGFLPGLYERHGFREVARQKFNPDYAPESMPAAERAKEPDVVFMVHAPQRPVGHTAPYVSEWDHGVAAQEDARRQALAPEKYKGIIASVAERELGRKPNAHDLALTEDKLHAAADAHPEDPASQRLKQLYADAHHELQQRVPQPEDLFHAAGGTIRGSYHPGEAAMSFSEKHAIPETITHEALHAVRQSLPELLQRKFENRYGVVGGKWTRDAEEHFVNDMLGVHNGTVTDPELVRNFHQLTHFVEGRTFTPLTTLDRGVPHAPMSQPRGPVVGEPRDPLNKNFTSGGGLLSGHHQADVVDAVAQHWHKVFRLFNRQDWQHDVLRFSTDVNRTHNDILVREDGRTAGGEFSPSRAGKISDEVDQFLGRVRDRGYSPEMESEDAGITAALQQYVDHLFPGRQPGTEAANLEATARSGQTGLKAPAGFRWVPQEIAGDLQIPTQSTSGLAHHVGNALDALNSAVTAATVYFKLGHFGTRYLTNAVANIMQGSATPVNLRATWQVAHELTPDEKLKALAASGTHYYEALPGAQGEGRLSRAIQHGVTPGAHALSPQWWAGYVDAPFRLNSLVYELRHSGVYPAGAEGVRAYLHDVEHYDQLDPARRAQVDGVVRRTNREAIAYDRLNDFEKRYLQRAVWFYPWVKGSTLWTGNAMLEHPFKSLVAGQAGVAAVKKQQADFGDLPSYSDGVFLFAHGTPFPLVADFSTFNPEATAGQLAQAPAHLNDVSGMLNPGLSGLYHLIGSTDSFGNHTNHPVTAALEGMVSPTPESQIAQAYLGRNTDQSHREYPAVNGDPFSKTYIGEILRMLVGPGTPRRFNPEAAHSLAQRERTGR